MIKTELCDVLGIEHPIIQGGMAWVATAELVSAVSEAGGLGVIGSGNAPGEWVRVQIRKVRSATDKPFGVNIMLMSPFAQEVINVCLEEKVPVVTTGAGSPGSFVESFKKAGVKVVPVVASVALAKRMQRYGADAIIAEGMESGGHVGEMTTITLVPMVVDVVSVPVVAGGGIADGIRELEIVRDNRPHYLYPPRHENDRSTCNHRRITRPAQGGADPAPPAGGAGTL